jgi:hypothetical protein
MHFMQQTLQLRKVRDLGEKISDSFLFLKRNFKGLVSTYFVFVVPFIILAVVVSIFFAGRLYSAVVSKAYDFQISDIFGFEFLIILLCLVMAYASYNTAIYSYFSLYDEQKGVKPTMQQVGQLYFKNVFRVLGYNIAVGFILILIAIIPYLIVMFIPLLGFIGQMLLSILFNAIMATMTNMYIREGVGISGATSRLFDLFRDKWWHVIGFNLVNYLIYYVFAGVLVFIGVMIFMVASLNMTTNPFTEDSVLTTGKISVYAIAIGVLFLIMQLFELIVLSGAAINYYSLCEEKDGTAIEEMIDAIGENNDKYGGVEEQY